MTVTELVIKQCSKCGENKPISEFHINRARPDKLKIWCKKCAMQHRSDWAKSNTDKIKCYHAQYYKAHKHECNARSKAYNRNNKDRMRSAMRRKKYNISEFQYAQLMVKQGGKCAICKTPADECTVLCIDHDHEKGIVRGLLCSTCNRAIGLFKDNPLILIAAADYLKEQKQNQNNCTS